MRPTSIYSLSAELGANTIDPYELNCRVRSVTSSELISVSLKPLIVKRTNLKRNRIATIPFTLKPCSPFTRRVIASFQRSDNLEKRKCFSLTFFIYQD